MPMTIDELKKDYAELYSQVKAEGRQEVQDEIEAKQTEAKQQAQQDMLSLAETLFGEQVKAKLSQAVEAGLTVDQIKAAQGLFESQNDGQGQDGQNGDTKAQLLSAIEQNTPDPASRAEGDNQGPKDFETAVQDQIKQQGFSRGEAIKAMAEQYPELHQQWIDGHNK